MNDKEFHMAEIFFDEAQYKPPSNTLEDYLKSIQEEAFEGLVDKGGLLGEYMDSINNNEVSVDAIVKTEGDINGDL